jgi:hypothetical protein
MSLAKTGYRVNDVEQLLEREMLLSSTLLNWESNGDNLDCIDFYLVAKPFIMSVILFTRGNIFQGS